jgi:hypothetical protein
MSRARVSIHTQSAMLEVRYDRYCSFYVYVLAPAKSGMLNDVFFLLKLGVAEK